MPALNRILLICSPSKTQHALDELLNSTLFSALHVWTLKDAKPIVARTPLSLIICASVFLDGTFRDLLRHLAEEQKAIPVFVVSLAGRNHECAEARWLGAVDCMPRPFTVEEAKKLATKAFEIIAPANSDE
jgi:DNA-binding NtrC family response regulator